MTPQLQGKKAQYICVADGKEIETLPISKLIMMWTSALGLKRNRP